MALTNAERQRRWREKHPAQANARLRAFKAQKKSKQPGATECAHEDRKVRVSTLYCGKCKQAFIFRPNQLEEAHKEWLSRAPELDGGE